MLLSGLSFSRSIGFSSIPQGSTDLLSLVSKCLDHRESDVVCISCKAVICIACCSFALFPSVLPIHKYVFHNLAQFS